ncbi:D-threitol dehydrogenase [Curtobacterium sp. MCPF17_050]|uniref:GolD/DthD family dehydrogenase n=1 Tax=Curtobacterium sp. MCPF17_050 TaxID=2175664 RepID=UPI000D8E2D47|nr:D-threitol dehydrogenase [Curtobacterium sp. MCPF17_050]WIB14778.1 D-threitol dehydrogenase [Curtobacterium sp. MCPF17_050]
MSAFQNHHPSTGPASAPAALPDDDDLAALLRPGPAHLDHTNPFTGRVAVVTGGASGIGNAVARALAGRGARVAVIDVRADASASAASELPGDGHLGIGCDVTDQASVDTAVAEVLAGAGRVEVLVNCAGIVALAPAEDLGPDAWARTLDVNLTGTHRVTQAVGRHMLAAGYGRIVTIASQAAHVGIDGHAAYCASKAGLLGLTRVLALEWGRRGVTVNTVSPTVVLTALGRSAWANEAGLRHQDEIPTGRFATPDEVAAAVLFLAGGSAAMVNGTDLRVDGGFTIR